MERTTVLTKAEQCDWPQVMIGGSHLVEGERAWRARIAAAPVGELQAMVAALAIAEERVERGRRANAAREEDERRAAESRKPIDADDPLARLDAERAEEARLAMERASSVAGRLERVEKLLARLVAKA